jgi:hypothetical protein
MTRDDNAGKRIAREHLQAIVDAITAYGAPVCCDEDGTEWFALANVIAALDVPYSDDLDADFADPESPLGRVVSSADLKPLWIEGEPWPMISFPDVLAHVTPFARAPVAIAYQTWLCSAFLPAIGRSGWYDPDNAHQPPVGQELTAIEQREDFRESINAIIPGMGDWFGTEGDNER